MTVTPRNHPRVLPVAGTAVAIVAAAFIANRLTATPRQTRPQLASQTTVGTASERTTLPPKERIRYQATIENWRRYRAKSAPD